MSPRFCSYRYNNNGSSIDIDASRCRHCSDIVWWSCVKVWCVTDFVLESDNNRGAATANCQLHSAIADG